MLCWRSSRRNKVAQNDVALGDVSALVSLSGNDLRLWGRGSNRGHAGEWNLRITWALTASLETICPPLREERPTGLVRDTIPLLTPIENRITAGARNNGRLLQPFNVRKPAHNRCVLEPRR